MMEQLLEASENKFKTSRQKLKTTISLLSLSSHLIQVLQLIQ